MTPPRRAKPSASDDQLAAMLHAVANLNDQLDLIHVGIRTLNGTQRVGVNSRIMPAASLQLSNSPGRLAGWQIHNGGAVAIAVRLHDGPDVNGDVIASFSIGIGADTPPAWFMPNGIGFVYGLFLEYPAGPPAVPLDGAVYLAPAAPIT
jgi:hypothetical protein